MGRLLSSALLLAVLAWGATELSSGPRAVFEAPGTVTFGAVYTERAVQATVVSPTPVTVSVHSGRKPANVFVGEERLAASAWAFETAKGVVTVALPAGTTALQLRFDDLVDLHPFQAKLPVVVVPAAGPDRTEAGVMEVTVSAEKVLGSWPWAGPEGLYELRAMLAGQEATGVQVSAAAAGGAGGVLLQGGTVLTLQGDAPGQKVPADRLECRLASAITGTQRVPKLDLPWAGSVVVEGEGFKAEGGGSVTRSTEHGNTHGGGCIYAWGTPGHWIAWEAAVPTAGEYILTIVLASQEPVVLRSFSIDGQPAAGAAVLRVAGTGGWGRTNADEWQAVQPTDGQGRPVRFRLSAGTHELRLSNLMGQHLNVDCLLLTPVQ